MSREEFPTLAILPWSRLKTQIALGGVDFIPWRMDSGTPESIFISEEKLKMVMSSYVDIHGSPIDHATLALHKSAKIDGSISQPLIHDISAAAQLLAFAVIADNEYFQQFGQCANSSCFRVVYQRIAKDDGIAISIGRRCAGGLLDGGYMHGEVHFPMPVQCQYVGELEPAIDLVQALSSILTRKSSLDARLLRVIRLFTFAYTDDSFVPEEQDVIMLMMAFEGLFRDCQGRNDLACRVAALLDKYGSITIHESIRQTRSAKGLSPEMWLHRAWMSECYQLRNDYVHGNPPKPLAWSEYEHLVFASWLFPFLVKLILASDGVYELTRSDIESLNAVDYLLNCTDWNSKPEDDNRTYWQLAKKDAAQDELLKERKLHINEYRIIEDSDDSAGQ